MRRPRPGIGAELLPIALILVCLAGTLGLVITMHRRAVVSKIQAKPTPKAPSLSVAAKPKEPPKSPISPTPEVVEEEAPIPPPPPQVDPTPKALASIAAEVAEQERARRAADIKSASLMAALKKAEAEASRWRTRESLTRAQLTELDRKARNLDREADALAMERDLLASERDAAKAMIQKAKRSAGGYSVLPNKTANGTWQRPVIIECSNGEAILQPRGLHFNLLDLSPLLGPRGSPLIGAVAKELLKIQGSSSPDGAPITPYIYFIVRPDGVRPFYDARSRLEPLGIAFGYELVEQDWEIEYPDFDALTAWDGSGVPFSSVKPKASVAGNSRGGEGSPGGSPIRRGAEGAMPDEGGRAFLWPADRPSPRGTNDPVTDSPYVWPSGRGGLVDRGSGSFLGSEEAQSSANRTNPSRPDGFEGLGDEDVAPRGRSRLGERSRLPSGERLPDRRGSTLDGIPPDDLIPVVPDGLPDFTRPENLVPDSRRPRPSMPTFPSPGSPPPRPANGRVRIDPNLLAEAAAADEEEEARRTIFPFDESPASLDQTKPTSVSPGSPSTSGAPATASPGAPPAGSRSTANSASSSVPPSTPSRAGSPPSSSLTSTPPSPGIELPLNASGTADGEGSDDKAKMPEFNPRKPIEKKSIRVPLDLVVACGPKGVVIHPGGYRISLATLRKQALLKTDLQTIVRNHELIDAMVKPVPRLQFLVETGGADTYAEARRQTVLSGLSWPVSVKVSENAPSTIFPKERF